MGKIKNYTRNESYSRVKNNGVIGWEHDERKRAGVGILRATENGPEGVPTGAYYIVADREGAAFGNTASILRNENGEPFYTRNKEKARKRAVRWMKNHP